MNLHRLSPPEHLGPYRLQEPLGSGMDGAVYRACHTETGAEVALKTLQVPDPALMISIRREAAALARLQHPGVVPICDQGVDHGLPWYAMALLHGQELNRWVSDRLHRDTTPSASAWRDLWTALHRICEALAYIHGEGVIHRDLKPSNIVVVDDQPVLIDFGMAFR
ncbi:MAG: protein kinase, partial [Myxococcota bacterium]